MPCDFPGFLTDLETYLCYPSFIMASIFYWYCCHCWY